MNQALSDSMVWTPLQKLLFRFIFILFGLFIIMFNNNAFPLFIIIMYYPMEFITYLLTGITNFVMGPDVQLVTQHNGSGDTLFRYVLLFFITILAVIGSVFWTIFDRSRSHYNTLYYWLTVAVRYYVALMLAQYGLVKVVKLQFPFPDLARLGTTYGESSPMGLAWTFLGFSTGYNVFMGIAELMAILLIFRRTVALGAIICLMTTANVMAINYFYDVPVKIVSTALFLMSVFLLVPNFYRLVNLFFRGTAVELRTVAQPVIRPAWLGRNISAIKIVVIFVPMLISFLYLITKRNASAGLEKSPLYGMYEVQDFNWIGKDKSDEGPTPPSWDKLIIQRQHYSHIKYNQGIPVLCEVRVDTLMKDLHIVFADDTAAHRFKYRVTGIGHLILDGKYFGDSVHIDLVKRKFQLMERGFHWINERPYNQ